MRTVIQFSEVMTERQLTQTIAIVTLLTRLSKPFK
jgi:hypothetical protein